MSVCFRRLCLLYSTLQHGWEQQRVPGRVEWLPAPGISRQERFCFHFFFTIFRCKLFFRQPNFSLNFQSQTFPSQARVWTQKCSTVTWWGPPFNVLIWFPPVFANGRFYVMSFLFIWIISSKVKGIPRQLNGSDCGVFTCQYAEFLSRCQKSTRTSPEPSSWFWYRWIQLDFCQGCTLGVQPGRHATSEEKNGSWSCGKCFRWIVTNLKNLFAQKIYFM